MAVSKKELGVRLRSAREAANLTQEAVATHLGVSRPTISQIEAGERAVSGLELDRLAFLYGRDIRDFFEVKFVENNAFSALFRADSDVIHTERVKGELRSCIAIAREQSNLENLLDIDHVSSVASYSFNMPSKKIDAIRQGERVAGEERKRLGLSGMPIENLPELLENECVCAHQFKLDDDVSGFTINDREIGPFVVINESHSAGRKRYSYAHEYAHVLMDRQAPETISRLSDRANLIEIRANAFAAAFLMPERGVRQFLSSLGKDKQSRSRAEVFDEEGAVPVEIRTGSELNIKLYDVIQLAHHFAVSRQAVLYRLLNLRLITQAEHEELAKQDTKSGKKLAELMFLDYEPKDAEKGDSMSRFLSLALEALRRDEISMSKFKELAAMAKLSKSQIQELVSTALKSVAT